MKLLEDRIQTEGVVLEGDVLKVGSFLNQQLDIELLEKIGEEFARLFADCKINKILTIESSGIAIACFTAKHFLLSSGKTVPVVFAKKKKTSNLGDDYWCSQAFSYTQKRTNDIAICKEFISENDRVLIIDDFLASGSALTALIEIARNAGAEIEGVGIAIEKAYQGGGDKVRSMGLHLESLARITSMSVKEGVKFGDYHGEKKAGL